MVDSLKDIPPILLDNPDCLLSYVEHSIVFVIRWIVLEIIKRSVRR